MSGGNEIMKHPELEGGQDQPQKDANAELVLLRRQVEGYQQKELLEEKLRRQAPMMKQPELGPSPQAYAQEEGLAPCESFDLMTEVSNILTEMRHKLAPVLLDHTAVPAEEKQPPAGPVVSGFRELVRQARTLLMEISI